MKKKIITIILVIFVLLGLLYYELSLITRLTTNENRIKIYFANQDINKHKMIEEKDIKFKLIREKNMESEYIEDIDEIIGKYTNGIISENSIIMKGFLLEKEDIRFNKIIPQGKSQITLDLDGENANGWLFKEGDIIDLLFCSNSDNIYEERFFSLEVYSILDENYEVLNLIDKENRPKYLVLFAEDEIVEKILFLKKYGEIKVVIKGKYINKMK